MKLGQTAKARQTYSDALTRLSVLLDRNKGTDSTLVDIFLLHKKSGNYEAATEIVADLMKSFEDHSGQVDQIMGSMIHFHLSELLFQHKDYVKCQQELQIALELWSENDSAHKLQSQLVNISN